tara:strand:- start:54 stop:245 length:192 start_codon:yes stop_codon:yes gene_type:complete
MSVVLVLWYGPSEESPMISTERSIIDEIRDDIRLDRRYEETKLLIDIDFYDDLIDYVFESYYD